MIKLRYYGGSFSNKDHRSCSKCGGKTSTSRSRIMSESIQFQSDTVPNGLKTVVFYVGRDYFVSDYEAEQLLKMTFVDINGIAKPKFKVIEDGK